MGGDRHGLIPPDDGETTAEGPQIAGEGGRLGPEWGAGREPHGGSGYAPVDTGHFHCAVAKRLMVQFGHKKRRSRRCREFSAGKNQPNTGSS